MTVQWTPEARERLRAIAEFVARDDPGAAARLLERLVKRGESLSRFPRRGRRVPERPEGDLRELIDGNYRLVYRVKDAAVEVLTVFEAHHLLPEDDLE